MNSGEIRAVGEAQSNAETSRSTCNRAFQGQKKRDLGDTVDSHCPFLDIQVQTATALYFKVHFMVSLLSSYISLQQQNTINRSRFSLLSLRLQEKSLK